MSRHVMDGLNCFYFMMVDTGERTLDWRVSICWREMRDDDVDPTPDVALFSRQIGGGDTGGGEPM